LRKRNDPLLGERAPPRRRCRSAEPDEMAVHPHPRSACGRAWRRTNFPRA
jgi:hypothetical protein